MPIIWDVRYEKQLETLSAKLDAIDMDRVLRRGIERTTKDLSEIVRQRVFESAIKSPADEMSPYDAGDGPPMAEQRAWKAKQVGPHSFVVEPDPRVRQRAIILEYGRGPITPQTTEYLKFNVNGVPMFRKSVSGARAYGYWRSAMQQIRSEDKFRQNLEDEYSDELERYF